jgi:membrane glycosyltransferase
MELHTAASVTGDRSGGHVTARQLCARYLERLPLSAQRRREILNSLERRLGLRNADSTTADTAAYSLREMHSQLAGDDADDRDPAYASVRSRLAMAGVRDLPDDAPRRQHAAFRLSTAPPIRRTSMSPKPWPLKPTLRAFRVPRSERDHGEDNVGPRDSGAVPGRPAPRERWHWVGVFRRMVLGLLIAGQTALATYSMTAVLPYHGAQPLETAMLLLFAVLFAWISSGFWTAFMGFLVLLRGGDRYAITHTAPGPSSLPIAAEARTAIVMPIRNEDVARVFAGLRATYDSLSRSGELEHFDFYVLSDSSDPDTRVAEMNAWLELCRDYNAFGRLFYRWRQHKIKRKSGNIADFCRRWGSMYRYMVVLDADSIMSGDCLTTLVRMMEANPDAGIIQSPPRAAGRDTLFARIQQFATRVYGPIFVAGLHFIELGEAHYWGHNAIIRVAPFIRHCSIGRLPGSGSLSGEILSHDFVEAALMRRAGWGVWIAYDLPGSYEEMPPNLADELKRDRRWCQGNIMNSRLLFANGLHPSHRAVFASGVMAYLSAPLWFAFLILSTALLAMHTLMPPKYFTESWQLFPSWPEWHPSWALALFSATATLLFLPKILSVLLIWAKDAEPYGGKLAVATSMIQEVVVSSLLAPVRMLFHTRFVLAAWLGRAIHWRSPERADAETGWGEALQRHGGQTLLGAAWAGGVYWLNPSFLWWLLPIVGALMVSIPIAVFSSRVSLGRHWRNAKLFVIPEESRPPREIWLVKQLVADVRSLPGFAAAVVDPVINALVCAAGVPRLKSSDTTQAQRHRLIQLAANSPEALSERDKETLLRDPIALSRLHLLVWSRAAALPFWRDTISLDYLRQEATASAGAGIASVPVARHNPMEASRGPAS